MRRILPYQGDVAFAGIDPMRKIIAAVLLVMADLVAEIDLYGIAQGFAGLAPSFIIIAANCDTSFCINQRFLLIMIITPAASAVGFFHVLSLSVGFLLCFVEYAR